MERIADHAADVSAILLRTKGQSLPDGPVARIVAMGEIAATMFTAGKRRYCAPTAIFMMHPISVDANGTGSSPLRAALEAALADEARTEAILRQRTRIPESVLAQRRSSDVYITPEQALGYGLIDEVRDFTLPPGEKLFQM